MAKLMICAKTCAPDHPTDILAYGLWQYSPLATYVMGCTFVVDMVVLMFVAV